jgi:hypothetical protein
MMDGVRDFAIELIREHYSDFGPTLAREKLIERHQIAVSKETLREWMTEAGIWTSRRECKSQLHQPRGRRDCLGELVQIDGSHHWWFENRGPKCALLVFIDDATGRLLYFALCGLPRTRSAISMRPRGICGIGVSHWHSTATSTASFGPRMVQS